MSLSDDERKILQEAGGNPSPIDRQRAVGVYLAKSESDRAEAGDLLVKGFLGHLRPSFHLIPKGGQALPVVAAGVLADKLETGTHSIIYGWPTVVVRDRDHIPKVSPLFAVQIAPEQGPDNQWELHATTEPELNLAVTASGIFDPSSTAEVLGLLEHGLPFGDAEAFCNLIEKVADLLGLRTSSPLDARILKPGAGREPGIYNAAISVLAERSIYTATLRKELQQLQSRDDWAATAAAHLLPGGFTQQEVKPTPSGPLAAALVCNHSQEKILKRFRSDPLTVVTGPPGTGKRRSRLCSNRGRATVEALARASWRGSCGRGGRGRPRRPLRGPGPARAPSRAGTSRPTRTRSPCGR